MNKNITERDKKILGELQKLSFRDKLFYTKHSQKDIEKILGLKSGNTLHFILYKIKINLKEERMKEFLNYFYCNEVKELTLEKIRADFGFATKQTVSKKIKEVFGLTLNELKEGIK